MQVFKCKDAGATHRSGTGPPLWTFGHKVARTAGRALLLCPPGNTAAASVKIILSVWFLQKRTPPFKHTHLTAFGPQMCFIFSTDSSQKDEVWSREATFFEEAICRHSYPERQRPCESSHNNNSADDEHNVD